MAQLPFALFNAWLLSQLKPIYTYMGTHVVVQPRDPSEYIYRLIILTAMEMPLAAAPLTRYFGHALFLDRPNASRNCPRICGLVAANVRISGVFSRTVHPAGDYRLAGFPLMLLWLIPFVRSPYLNEIILLERNPFSARPGRITTSRRSQSLHAGSRSMLFARFLVSRAYSAER